MCLSTGNRYLDIGLSVALGAATGGLGLSTMATSVGTSLFTAANIGVVTGSLTGGLLGAAGGAVIGLGTGLLGAALSPQQQAYNYANTGMPDSPQPYNTQHTKVTGSGGRQAAAVLASEMKRAKSLRSRQAGAEDYGLGMDVTGTGLQIA